MHNPMDFSGRTVLVTGGGKGVGRGISERFLAAGAEVAICGRNPPDSLPAAGGREAFFVACDVRRHEQLEALVNAVIERCGRLDVLVNNAGGAPHAEAATASPRFHESIIALNLTSALHAAQLANRVMQQQEDGGSIINIASVSTIRPSPGTAAYGAANSLAVEWGPKVRINAIIAGLVETEQSHLHYGDAEGVAAVGRTIPLGRMAVPGDIGDACLFLASPLASYISGSSIAVHGGGEKPAFLQAANAGTGA